MDQTKRERLLTITGESGQSGLRPAPVSRRGHSATVPNAMLPCLICGIVLDSALPEGMGDNQPYAGTVFWTHGHYGSTVFDPMTGDALEMVVCDECLTREAEAGKVVLRRASGRNAKRRDSETWLGPKGEHAVAAGHAPERTDHGSD